MSKKFLVIGNMNAITYKEIFPLIKDNKLWLGMNAVKNFATTLTEVENDKIQFIEDGVVLQKFGNIIWYTNIDNKKRNTPLDLYKHYNAEEYCKYNNFDAINVDKVCDIPMDYDGVIGCPITFLDKYCPKQFEIVGCADADIVPNDWNGAKEDFIKAYYEQGNTGQYQVGNRLANYFDKNGKAKIPYKRILIRRKKENNDAVQ